MASLLHPPARFAFLLLSTLAIVVVLTAGTAQAGTRTISPATLPEATTDLSAVWSGSEAIAFGGHTRSAPTARIVGFDPATDTVRTMTGALPRGLDGLASVWSATITGDCPTGCAYVFGGHNDHDPHPSGAGSSRYAGAYRFSPQTQTLTTLPWSLPVPLSDAAVAWDPRTSPHCTFGCAYLFGGLTESASITGAPQVTVSDAIYRIDVHAGVVTRVATLPAPRWDAAAWTDGTFAYLTGGARDASGPSGPAQPTLRFDLDTHALATVSPAVARSGHALVHTGESVFTYGGGHGADRFDGDWYDLDVARGTFLKTGLHNGNPRVGHAMVWTGSGIVTMGGTSDQTVFDRIEHVRFPAVPTVTVDIPYEADRMLVTSTTGNDWTYDAPVVTTEIWRAHTHGNTPTSYARVAVLSGTNVTWVDTDIKRVDGFVDFHWYKARAIDSRGAAHESGVMKVRVPERPDPPYPIQVEPAEHLGTLHVTWLDWGGDGGRPVTEIKLYRDAVSPSTLVATLPPTAMEFVDTGLPDGVTVTYYATKTNVLGESATPSSASGTTVARAVPGAVAGLAASTAGPGALALEWSAAPRGDGPVLEGYRVYRYQHGAFTLLATLDASALGWTHAGLAGGEQVTYSVRAFNEVGEGSAASALGRALDLPSAPTAGLVTRAPPATVSFAWSEPAEDGGSDIDAYVIEHVTTWTGGDGDDTPELRLPLNDDLYWPTKWFDLPPGSLADATAARLLVYGQSADCTQDLWFRYETTRGAWTPRRVCDLFGPTPGWASIPVALTNLEEGRNWVEFDTHGPTPATPENAAMSLFLDAEHDGGDSHVLQWRNGLVDHEGELLVRLELDLVRSSRTTQERFDASTGPGATHTLRVRAENALGTGPALTLEGAAFEVPRAPSAPTLVRGPAPDGIAIAWDAPESERPILSYDVLRIPYDAAGTTLLTHDATVVATLPPDARAHADAGLDPGRRYAYSVRATSDAGEGTRAPYASLASADVPGAVGDLLAVRGSGPDEATLTWAAPASDGGFPVERYHVLQDGALLATLDAPAATYVASGLAPASTHQFQVRAESAVGAGTLSGTSLTMWDVPGAPPPPTAQHAAGALAVELAWVAPSKDGGTPIEGYHILRAIDGGPFEPRAFTTGLAFVDEDVEPATTYRYAITARSFVGEGPASAARTQATLAAVPDCGTRTDAGESGLALGPSKSCTGHLAPGDDRDVLLVTVPAGHRIDATASGPVLRLEGPDGTVRPVLDGIGRAHADAAGTWRIVAESASTATYTVAIVHAPAPSLPTAVTLAARKVARPGDLVTATLSLSDHHHEDARAILDWGDGTLTAIPTQGLVPGDGATRGATRSFASIGTYALALSGETRDGRSLTPASASLVVVEPDDCGAGDAPDTGAYTLRRARCYGELGGADVEDRYLLDVSLVDAGQLPAFGREGDVVEVTITPGAGVELDASLGWWPHANAPSISGEPFVTKRTLPDGTIVLSASGFDAPPNRFRLLVSLEDGEGAYEVRVTRENEPLLENATLFVGVPVLGGILLRRRL